MKKIVSVILIIFVTYFAFGQNVKTKTGFSIYIDSLGNVSDTNLRVVEKYNKDNKCIEVLEVVTLNSNENYTLRTYDDNGKLTEFKKSYFNERVVVSEKYGYDEKGNMLWKSVSRGKRHNKYNAVNSFDSEENIEKTAFVDSDGQKHSFIVYAFDSGKLKEENHFKYPNFLLLSKSYTYDNENILTYQEYNSKSRKTFVSKYNYNKNGDVASINTSDKDKDVEVYSITKEYDSKGLEIKESKRYISSKEIQETFYKYEFWEE